MRPLNAAEKDILNRVVEKPDLQIFFFRKLKGLRWFDDLAQHTFFDATNNPATEITDEGTINAPFWPVTEYLVTVSSELSIAENEEYAQKILQILRDVTLYSRDKGISNYRTWWQFSKILIHIPLRFLRDDDIDIIDYWLNDNYDRGLVLEQVGEFWLSKALEQADSDNSQFILQLVDRLYCFRCRVNDSASLDESQITFSGDIWHVNRITEKLARSIGKSLGLNSVVLFQNKLDGVLSILDNDKYSYIWRPAIEQHSQNSKGESPLSTLIDAYRDAFQGFIECCGEQANPYVDTILQQEQKTLIRVAIFVVDMHFAQLNEHVDSILEPGFFAGIFRHEFWHLLNKHYRDFTSIQKSAVLRIISEMKILDDEGAEDIAPTAYKKSKWLSAIKDAGQKENALYQQCLNITNLEPENPDFEYHMTVGWLKPESPIPMEELLPLNAVSLIQEIESALMKDNLNELSREGLLNIFKEVVKNRAAEFIEELPIRFIIYITKDLFYTNLIFEAYRDLWTENRELPWSTIWDKLITFALLIVREPSIWTINGEQWNGQQYTNFNRYLFIRSISELIEDGTRTDDHAFDEKYLPQVYELLKILLDNCEGEIFKIHDDAVTKSINNSRGHCIKALVNLALRYCRISDKKSGEHSSAWIQFEPIFDRELLKESEFITLVSQYILHFMYMSNDWTIKNLYNIFCQTNYRKWICAMQGYAYVNTIESGVPIDP